MSADPSAIADAILAIAAGIPGVKDARLGLNTLTLTPAAEVWMTGGNVRQQRAAPTNELLERHALEVHFYSALRANQDADERLLAGIAAAFIRAIHASDFDVTLGGLVEMTRVTRYGFDVIARNGHPFRAVLIEVEAGEL